MKNLLTLFVLFLGLGMANAQTEAETIEWFNKKKADVTYISSNTLRGSTMPKLSISSEQLHAYADDGAYTKISWKTIKDIKTDKHGTVIIVSNTMYEGNNSYIRFDVADDVLRLKYFKALKHMATLKGAKLVNDDLF